MDIFQISQEAKAFVESALHYSKDMAIGNGPQGPFDHLFRLKSPHYNAGATPRFNPDDLFLYAVTDSRMNKKWGRSITDAVRAAIEGGATIIQLRSVTWSLTLSVSKLNISIPCTFFLFWKKCAIACFVSTSSAWFVGHLFYKNFQKLGISLIKNLEFLLWQEVKNDLWVILLLLWWVTLKGF